MLGQLENNPIQSACQNKKIFLFIFFYIAINILLKWVDQDSAMYRSIIQKIEKQTGEINMQDLVYSFQYQQSYQGTWHKIAQPNPINMYLKSNSGIFEMKLIKLIKTKNHQYFDIVFHIIDGEYIDDGTIEYQFKCSNKEFNTTVISANLQSLSLIAPLDGRYDKDDIFVTMELGPVNATLFNISFYVTENKQLDIKITLQTEQINISLTIDRESDKLIKSVIFAAVMFVVSFGPFSALISMTNNIYSGIDSASNYSLLTVCLTTMWDTVICLVAIVYAFASQQNLILFMIPAFLMCLIFSNLEPRLMILVYEAFADHNNTRTLICRFNLIHYGSLLLIYPLILITNFNSLFFISISCLLFPQIYLNSINGNRPDPTSKYYRQFLLYRFLLVFYIKCYPYNVFRFKPNYYIAIICLFLLAFQYALVYIQKLYGPKKILPKFMLPAVYNYNYEEEANLEDTAQQAECAICLTSLHTQPSSQVELEVSYRVMRTPCKHRYHSSCLIEWMKIKPDCPQCRSHLPSYQ